MTDNEILKKAIEKAVKNGFDINYFYEIRPRFANWRHLELLPPIIFSHEFCKAFFKGKEDFDDCCCKKQSYCETFDCPEDWKLHLQVMVLEPEPLKYLRRFLDD